MTAVDAGGRVRVRATAAEGAETCAAALTAHLDRARGGDEASFTVVFRAVQPGLLRYLTALVGDEADDVAGEAWAQACRDLGRFRGDIDGFRGWVATIARNRAIDSLRARGRRPHDALPVEELRARPGRDDTEAAALESLSTGAALALIQSLPRDQAEAVLLRVVVGLDARATGQVLGKRAGAVRAAAFRGLRSLAHGLDPATTVASHGHNTFGAQNADEMR